MKTVDLDQPDRITKRDLKMLELLSDGYTYRDIAREFDMAEGTLKQLGSKLIQKMGADNGTHAVALALRRGLIYGAAPVRLTEYERSVAMAIARGQEPSEIARATNRKVMAIHQTASIARKKLRTTNAGFAIRLIKQKYCQLEDLL